MRVQWAVRLVPESWMAHPVKVLWVPRAATVWLGGPSAGAWCWANLATARLAAPRG